MSLRLRAESVFDIDHRPHLGLQIRNAAGESRRVTIDLTDRASQFSVAMLQRCDVYLKRSYEKELVLALPAPYRQRVLPFGLNFASLSRRAVPMHLRLARALLAQRLRAGEWRRPRTALRDFQFNCRMIVGIPPAEAFQRPPARPDSRSDGDRVLLQTRVWPPEPSADSLEQVNAERIALVQVLAKELGARFLGGIVADDFSRLTCPPDVLVHQATNRREYAKTLHAAKIGVYVRGIHHSIGFKMAEYLAAGLCIVSEPLRHELPVPMIEGTHYLCFHTVDQCVAHCAWLLSHPAEAERMQAANIDYYRRWIAPAAHVREALARCFSQR